ncbi:MAG: hypothetical protein WCV91_02675 [Candidatus Margulisiibacteriota bacterium]
MKKRFLSLLLVALGIQSIFALGGAPQIKTIQVEPPWNPPVNNLSCYFESPSELKAGENNQITLNFKNYGHEPIRIYFVNGEMFRYGISTLYLRGEGKNGLFVIQPEPRPHGYVVTEKDFNLIDPGKEVSFVQNFYFQKVDGTKEEFADLTWVYKNFIKAWPGGKITLDGTTESLFGGGDIPNIWTGEIKCQKQVKALY